MAIHQRRSRQGNDHFAVSRLERRARRGRASDNGSQDRVDVMPCFHKRPTHSAEAACVSITVKRMGAALDALQAPAANSATSPRVKPFISFLSGLFEPRRREQARCNSPFSAGRWTG